MTQDCSGGNIMKRIGAFRREGSAFIGEISTLHLHVHARIILATEKLYPNAPDYILIQSRTDGYMPELGSAWQKHTRESSIPYLEVEIDDPLCPHPIHAILCEGKSELYILYWDRNSAGDHMAEKLFVQEELKPGWGVLRAMQNITQRQRDMFPELALL
jgi:uncharacterized protein (DUF736 family)